MEPLLDVLINVVAASINVNDMFMLGYLLNANDDARNNKWKYTTLKVDTFTKLIEGLCNWFIVGDIIRT